MKSIVSVVWKLLVSVGEARHAAFLTRQGKINEAKAIYGK
jgi:hypothetical protein